jgi:muramidase (phage lysozyme)
MSIFRETFPLFVQNELKRRQDGMAARTPAFLQQLNTRNAWVRMTSGVNTSPTFNEVYNNDLASFNVLQGGTLLDGNTGDIIDLKYGIGGAADFSSAYNNYTGGIKNRLGIRPMPGITGVSIQSKGAYGSLQEATVSFNCWDIRQLENLELLYMRPGYTVLLEFGWDFAKKVNGTLPSYDILDIANDTGISLNDAFADIYSLIEQSNGTYDALLGYVKNYSWSARDDGGYDCTTTIISLGEVLESLKCNWVPIETTAFSDTGLLNLDLPQFRPLIKNSYELGIIPGLLHEMWGYLRSRTVSSKNFSTELKDPKKGTKYQLCLSETMQGPTKFNRGGLPKPLGDVEQGIEGWITLGSFCDLLNNYVLLKDQNNNSLTQITTYETDSKGNIIYEKDQFGNILPKSLKCIASPLSLSTNLGICLIRNDNWASLGIKTEEEEKTTDQKNTPSATTNLPNKAVQLAINFADFSPIGNDFIVPKVTRSDIPNYITTLNPIDSITTYKYNGNVEDDLKDIANQIIKGITKIELVEKEGSLRLKYTFFDGKTFTSKNTSTTSINLFDWFTPNENRSSIPEVSAREELFNKQYKNTDGSETGIRNPFDPGNSILGPTYFKDNTSTTWSEEKINKKIKDIFSEVPLNNELISQVQDQTTVAATEVAEEAKDTLITAGTLQFLVPGSLNSKTLGNISNIYVNINYLYSQAISKNIASNDNQNTNNISIREYLQSILRDIQNSLGNINDFDIQIDERTAIGRIIDLNFTGDPNQKLFTLQIHNTNSVVRKYGFQSKIFPEMGSIIAISAQDPSGIGKLGYDNATLIAWNEGIRDRLIPKKTFTSDILIPEDPSKPNDPTAFILPFLTKIYDYFQAIKGQDRNNTNFLFGGLDFAYRDFLANLNRFDRRNDFKTIIPTELNITLDGIGGMVIGNLFTINQDIVPKGYRSVPNRSLAYIVTKLGHNIQDNDWTTELSAYPVIFETATGTNVASKWNNQKYPGDTVITIRGETAITLRENLTPAGKRENLTPAGKRGNFTPAEKRIAAFGDIDTNKIPAEAKPLLDTIAYTEGTAGGDNNGYDIIVGYGKIAGWTETYSKGHPNIKVYIPSIKNYSSAAGRYQFLTSTWKQVSGDLFFNKPNQDLAGWKLINAKDAAKDAFKTAQDQIKSNSINFTQNQGFITFLNKNYKVWASLPNAGGAAGYEGQGGTYSPQQVYQVYIEAVKKYI